MKRRTFIGSLLAASAFAAAAPRAGATPLLGEPREFTINLLRRRARELAGRPFEAPPAKLPAPLADLGYDGYRDIRFRSAEAMWAGQAPFTVEFFHLGFYYRQPVRIFDVHRGEAREVGYDPALFNFGANAFEPATIAAVDGFAGFRIHYPLNETGELDELIAFLGASYFRALGRGLRYGLSARGLALGAGSEKGEEFPFFSEFYLERPTDANSLVIHALLNSRSVTGAYTFTIRPGDATITDVLFTLYPRVDLTHVGIAPLTSMFFFAANDRTGVDDFRPAVHDSEGLLVWNGAGEWLWRPLVNPARLRVSAFVDRNPKGFGLMQRNRDFGRFQDLESRYELRPSLWVEPVGDWGNGSVTLLEIPTAEEINDNIVAFWRPGVAIKAGTEWQAAYRLHWCRELPPIEGRPARVVSTAVGRGRAEGLRHFVIEFAGGALPAGPDPDLTLNVVASHGRLRNIVTHFNEVAGTWRAFFDLEPQGDAPIELRCHLAGGADQPPLTETWTYQWTD